MKKNIMAQDLQDKYKDLPIGEELEDSYHVAGRVMAVRNSGMFIDLDIGDIVGFEGTVRRTPRGELTIKSTSLEILSKSLLPLPEKFHGLTDVETKYRQRYVDMIVNDDVKKTFQKRSLIIQKIREFLIKKGLWKLKLLCFTRRQAVLMQNRLLLTTILLIWICI